MAFLPLLVGTIAGFPFDEVIPGREILLGTLGHPPLKAADSRPYHRTFLSHVQAPGQAHRPCLASSGCTTYRWPKAQLTPWRPLRARSPSSGADAPGTGVRPRASDPAAPCAAIP